MKIEKLKEIKDCTSFLFEYSAFGFYGTLFMLSYIVFSILWFFLQWAFWNNPVSFLSSLFSYNGCIFLFSILSTLLFYKDERENKKKIISLREKFNDKYNKKGINQDKFFYVLSSLIKELEEKELICFSKGKEVSKISKKEFKKMLKIKLLNEKTVKELKKELLK